MRKCETDFREKYNADNRYSAFHQLHYVHYDFNVSSGVQPTWHSLGVLFSPNCINPGHDDQEVTLGAGLHNVQHWASCYFACRSAAVAKYCNEYVCVSVCLSARISLEPHSWSLPNFVHVAYGQGHKQHAQKMVHIAHGRGSLLFRRRCDTLCTSGFVNDIMFVFYNVPCSGMNFAKRTDFA